jgi:aspartate kinase
MKFGGTSVEDAAAIRRTAAVVRGRRDKGLEAIVVVSAMAKVTDQLLAAAAAAGTGDKSGALALSARLRSRHLETAGELVKPPSLSTLLNHIQHDFDALDDLLRGIAAVGELTPRTTDLVVSFGERLSSQIVAAAFDATGLKGTHLDARLCIITDDQYGKAVPQEALIEQRMQQHALPLIEQASPPPLAAVAVTSPPLWSVAPCTRALSKSGRTSTAS